MFVQETPLIFILRARLRSRFGNRFLVSLIFKKQNINTLHVVKYGNHLSTSKSILCRFHLQALISVFLFLQVFPGNKDQSEYVQTNAVSPAIDLAWCVRIIPVTWHNHISMRFDVQGCLGTVFD